MLIRFVLIWLPALLLVTACSGDRLTLIASDVVIALDPDQAEAYNNRGVVKANRGDLENAIKDFDRAIELDPEYAIAYDSRGVAYFGKGDLDRVIADLDHAIELDVDDG